MIQYKGIVRNIDSPVVGLVTRNALSVLRGKSVLVSKINTFLANGFAGFITIDNFQKTSSLPQVKVTIDILDKLNEGDCVLIGKDGVVTVVWEKNAKMNPLLLTEMCDCRCMMCPQPPKPNNKKLLEICRRIIEIVTVEDNQTICLTGGEPTLLRQELLGIFSLIRNKHPNSEVMLLTNGKSFSDFDFTRQYVTSKPNILITCVSLHSDVDEVHDKIVGVKNSFYKTIQGLHNLARFRELIELRVVVSYQNANHLESIANFIQRNFPFIYHCVFMGMEFTGNAIGNYNDIWIDPFEYRDQLSRAVRVLSRSDVSVSIYNLPLCLIDRISWRYARQSISGWKNNYLPVCDECAVKSQCGGIFTTSGLHQSPHICPQ